MDCFQDFCLFCEKETYHAPYCSSRCRRGDQLRSGTMLSNDCLNYSDSSYQPISSASASASATSRSQADNRYDHHGSLSLDCAWRGPGSTVRSVSGDSHELRRSRASRSLSACSSQSSFSMSLVGGHLSSQAIPHPPTISETARKELNQYAELFDQTREQRRPS